LSAAAMLRRLVTPAGLRGWANYFISTPPRAGDPTAEWYINAPYALITSANKKIDMSTLWKSL
jgi:hypothetical protein